MEKAILNEAIIEALIFASEDGAVTEEILKSFETDNEFSEEDKKLLKNQLENLIKKYQQAEFGFELVCTAGRYQFLTKKAYHNQIQKMHAQKIQKSLGQAAMETLAIVAYKQPCVKSEIESIRGVNCDYSIDRLLDKNLIVITGQSDAPGKPLIYATSSSFTDYLGIDTLSDLPHIKELILQDNFES